MRYAQPRKLQTKRGQLKAALNAWCLTCKQPMARHGKNFSCAGCHVATRWHIEHRRPSQKQSSKNTRSETNLREDSYPYCLSCRLRMKWFSRSGTGRVHGFRCQQCKTIVASHLDYSKVVEKEKQILFLMRQGYLDSQIIKKMSCHRLTVKRLRKLVTNARRCDCGQLFHHSTKCFLKPGWQATARERRSDFEDLLVRINRRVPSAFPDEMRSDICQEMLLEILRSIEKVLANTPRFISEYKKRYPVNYYSIDANPVLLDRIAG